jgi:hypothetical protein
MMVGPNAQEISIPVFAAEIEQICWESRDKSCEKNCQEEISWRCFGFISLYYCHWDLYKLLPFFDCFHTFSRDGWQDIFKKRLVLLSLVLP